MDDNNQPIRASADGTIFGISPRSPRVWRELDKANIECSENRVARLMQKDNLVAVQRRKFRPTTDSKHNWPIAPNILNRNFVIDAPNKIWVTDMTYIWTGEGWMYLAFVLDLHYRGVIGLSMSSRMTDELTQNALKQAIMRRRPPEGLIHHSDRGSQYASGDYQDLLKEHKIIPSMSRKGDCWDNAVGESFVHTLKVEKIHRCRFRTREEAKLEVFVRVVAAMEVVVLPRLARLGERIPDRARILERGVRARRLGELQRGGWKKP